LLSLWSSLSSTQAKLEFSSLKLGNAYLSPDDNNAVRLNLGEENELSMESLNFKREAKKIFIVILDF
jgi:hypothetical protein